MKPYNHLPGYLHRWTFFKLKRLHIRIHHILSEDKTPFLHNHPFYYISIILSGGYSEIVEKNSSLVLYKHNKFNILFRKDNSYHRIISVKPNTKTLFLTWKTPLSWSLKSHQYIKIPINYWNPDDGLYINLNSKEYRLRKNSIWLIKALTIDLATSQNKPSIHQQLSSSDWLLVNHLKD